MGQLSSGEFLVVFVLAAGAGTAVFFHAERNKIKHPSAWASGVFLCLAIVLPLYALYVRRVRKQRAAM
jgi:4-amino-4-deoxy-L-arabinose transferase-like glycosyltransferase